MFHACPGGMLCLFGLVSGTKYSRVLRLYAVLPDQVKNAGTLYTSTRLIRQMFTCSVVLCTVHRPFMFYYVLLSAESRNPSISTHFGFSLSRTHCFDVCVCFGFTSPTTHAAFNYLVSVCVNVLMPVANKRCVCYIVFVFFNFFAKLTSSLIQLLLSLSSSLPLSLSLSLCLYPWLASGFYCLAIRLFSSYLSCSFGYSLG